MLIGRQIAHALSELCPGLSAEGMAVALGLQLCPLPCVQYRYLRTPSLRVEYNSLATPDEQERCLQRAVVLRALEMLQLGTPALLDITADVFERLRLPPAHKRSA